MESFEAPRVQVVAELGSLLRGHEPPVPKELLELTVRLHRSLRPSCLATMKALPELGQIYRSKDYLRLVHESTQHVSCLTIDLYDEVLASEADFRDLLKYALHDYFLSGRPGPRNRRRQVLHADEAYEAHRAAALHAAHPLSGRATGRKAAVQDNRSLEHLL